MVLLVFDRCKSRNLHCRTSPHRQLRSITSLSLIAKGIKTNLIGMLHYINSQNITHLHGLVLHTVKFCNIFMWKPQSLKLRKLRTLKKLKNISFTIKTPLKRFYLEVFPHLFSIILGIH